ncbi:HEPN/Toprim-associated domain-containing protein [Caballeronia sp. INML1]|uniref:HEPN/Toprim-associated domain-containing protein n=1 Tax=Caballeronia sp. INML1 TaxID=2921760 RepID=UPI0020293D68|nr:HEPN/Toprim-associated domain-containing protein [Caballeronia sp. INML1]
MDCFAHATIGGYQVATTLNCYSPWRFLPEDRIVRCRPKKHLNPLTYGMTTDKTDAEKVDIEFVYSTTAGTLRQRLGRAGFNRATLEKEVLAHLEKLRNQSESNCLQLTGGLAEAYGETFSLLSFENWLHVLGEAVEAGQTSARRRSRNGDSIANPLVNLIVGSEKRASDGVQPEHAVLGFPCTSLDNMAVALLEVTPGSARCELDVTSFVLHRGDKAFDDMLREDY